MAQFTNQAQLTYNNVTTNSNIAVGEILEVLSVTKTAVRDTYGQQDNVTYIISIVNSGNTPFTGVTVTDDLGAYQFNQQAVVPLDYIDGTVRYYVNGVLQATPTVEAGPPLRIENLTIPADGNAIIVYEASVNEFAPLDTTGTIDNTVTVSGSGITAVTADETISAEQTPVLSITKSISPVPVAENGVVTYTFLIQNTGNTAITTEDAVSVTDTFDPVLRNLTVTFNGEPWSETTNYTYSDLTGVFTTAANQIEVPAAAYVQDLRRNIGRVV